MTIKHNNKNYIFDPESMNIMQWEAAEREVIDARYYELIKSHADMLLDPKTAVPSFNPNNPEDVESFNRLTEAYKLSQAVPEKDWTDEMKQGREYYSRLIRSAEHNQTILRDFHINLVKSGGRIRMVEGLLWDPSVNASDVNAVSVMKKVIREQVVPNMKLKEVEEVISNFLSCSEFVEHLSLSYLRKQGE